MVGLRERAQQLVVGDDGGDKLVRVVAARLGEGRQSGDYVAEVAALASGCGCEDVVGVEVAHHRAVDQGGDIGGSLVAGADRRGVLSAAAGEGVLARLRHRLGVVGGQGAGEAVGQVAPGGGYRVRWQLLAAEAVDEVGHLFGNEHFFHPLSLH